MNAHITGVAHVKLPVSDLARSVAWYRALLDMELALEFVERGTLRGAALVHRASGVRIALRDRTVCAGQPVLTGFDAFALQVPTAQALHDLAARCERLGLPHEHQDRGRYGAALDVPDPDGTIVRFIYDAEEPPPFLGLEFDGSGLIGTYNHPRLSR
ncbi:VOC family protein [Actinomadura sp. NPDC048394]|uniref:VOC family protein n=1 Tax=Actinomadura sp. NPDC048394 TaxID=3158223 RepID=UPI0033C63279